MKDIERHGQTGAMETAGVDAETLKAATVFLRQVERMGGGRTVVSVPVRDPQTVVYGRPAAGSALEPADTGNAAQGGSPGLSGPVYVNRLYVRPELFFAFWLGVGAAGAIGGMAEVFANGPGTDAAMTAPALIAAMISIARANKLRDKHHARRGARAMIGKGPGGVPITEAVDQRPAPYRR